MAMGHASSIKPLKKARFEHVKSNVCRIAREQGLVAFRKVPSELNRADLGTKPRVTEFAKKVMDMTG